MRALSNDSSGAGAGAGALAPAGKRVPRVTIPDKRCMPGLQ